MISAVMSAFGAILIRLGLRPNTSSVVHVKELSVREGFSFSLRLLKNVKWLAGVAMVLMAWGLNMYGYQNADVTFTKPLYSINVVFVLIISRYFLKEKLERVNLFAACLISAGVIMISFTPSKTGSNNTESASLVGFFSVIILLQVAFIAIIFIFVPRYKKSIPIAIVSGIFFGLGTVCQGLVAKLDRYSNILSIGYGLPYLEIQIFYSSQHAQ